MSATPRNSTTPVPKDDITGFYMCVGSCLVSLLLTAATFGQMPRSIWVWEHETYRMLDENPGTYRKDTLDFLQRRGVGTIYLYADQYHQNAVNDYRPCDPNNPSGCPANRNVLTDNPDQYRSLISDIHSRGMNVYALLGSAFLHSYLWHRPENRDQALTAFQNVLSYNAMTSDPNERFDGFNTDLEPWSDSDFAGNEVQHAQWYLDTQAQMVQLRDQAVSRGDPGADIPVGPAMAFWTDGPAGAVTPFQWQNQTKPWSEHNQDVHDYVTIMDFRDTANGRVSNPSGDPSQTDNGNGLIGHAKVEAAYAQSIDKPFYIGLLTGPASPSVGQITFLQEGAEWMERELALTQDYFTNQVPNTAFAGLAIQDLIDYQRLVHLHWSESSDGVWGDANKWKIFEHNRPFETRPSGSLPRELDGILIQPDTDATVTGPMQDMTIFWLTIGAKTDGVATLDLQGHQLTVTHGAVIENRGRLSGHGTVSADVGIKSGGDVQVLSGDMITFNGGVHSAPGSTFSGNGTFRFNGGYHPADGPMSVGFEGSVVLGTDNTLTVELGGLDIGQFDQLVIDGDATIGGDLVVQLIDGFTLATNQRYTILSVKGILNGRFNDLSDGQLVGHFGQDLFITYTGGLDGKNVQLFTVPEPSTTIILATTGWVCLYGRRRRNTNRN